MLKSFPPRFSHLVRAPSTAMNEENFSFYYVLKSQRGNIFYFLFPHFPCHADTKRGKRVEDGKSGINKTAEPLNYPVIHFLFSPPLYFFISQF